MQYDFVIYLWKLGWGAETYGSHVRLGELRRVKKKKIIEIALRFVDQTISTF